MQRHLQSVSAILSGVPKRGHLRYYPVFAIAHQAHDLAVLTPVLLVFAILTIAIAVISMLVEKNLKKLIAFSSIENMGIILAGISVASPVAIFWVLFQIIGHALTKASLFFSAGILHRQIPEPYFRRCPG